MEEGDTQPRNGDNIHPHKANSVQKPIAVKISGDKPPPTPTPDLKVDSDIYLTELKFSIDEHYQDLTSHLTEITSAKSLFDSLKTQKVAKEQKNTDLKSKFDQGKENSQTQISKLESANDKIAIELRDRGQDITRKGEEISKLEEQQDLLRQKYHQQKQQKDQEFENMTKTKGDIMKDLIGQVRAAKQEMSDMLEKSVSDRVAMMDRLQDLNRQIDNHKEPKFNPDDLKQAEKERKELTEQLSKLKANRDLICSEIDVIDEANDQLEKTKNNLSSHKEINKDLKKDRDEAAQKLNELNNEQKGLYDDNVEILDKLQEVEEQIVDQDKYNVMLNDIIDLLKERINFDVKDLDERLRKLEDDIVTIDHGTHKMDKKVDHFKSKVDSQNFLDALDRIQEKIKKLNDENDENGKVKDQLRDNVRNHEKTIKDMEPKDLSVDEIQKHRKNEKKLEDNIKDSEAVKNDHMKQYKSLSTNLNDLESDIQNDYERQIKNVQKKDEDWAEQTTKNIDESKKLLDELNDKIEDDNPYMKRFKRKLANAREKLNDLKNQNINNKKDMDELANRNLEDDDYLGFIIDLAEDQQDSDALIEDTKKGSDDLMKVLNQLKEELNESDRTSKEEVLEECRKKIALKYKKLPNLEDRLIKLEKGVSTCLRTTELALQILDKDHKEYEEVQELDKSMKHLEKDTDALRADKNKLSEEMEDLKKAIEDSDAGSLSMNDILQLQKRCNSACDQHETISQGIDDGMDRLKDLQIRLEQILTDLRDILKKDADSLANDMTDKMDNLHRFLQPKGKINDSVQRPEYLRSLLEETYVPKEDPNYNQYQEYLDLVKSNLEKCSDATKDLKLLDSNVGKVLKDYKTKSENNDSVIDQIDLIQSALKRLNENKDVTDELNDTINKILSELGQEKEQEIIDFLNSLRNEKYTEAQEKLAKVTFSTSELERRIVEVDNENETFVGQLNKAGKSSKSKEKTKMIDQLLKDSDGSKRDLSKIRNDADSINKTLGQCNLSKVNLKDLDSLMKDLDDYESTVIKKIEDVDKIDEEIEERKKKWREYLMETEAKDKLVKELMSLIPSVREKYERFLKSHKF